MSQPTSSQVHVNRPLTNISIAFIQAMDKFIADKVFPAIPVRKQGDLYYIYNREDWNRIEVQKRAPATESAGSGFNLDTDSYFADVFALHKDVADQERANQDQPIDLDRDSTEFVTLNHLLKRDKEWSDAFFGTGKWTTDRTGVPGVPTPPQFKQWNDPASTPIEDIDEDIDRIELLTGFTPNTLVLGKDVWRALKNHPDIIDRMKNVQNMVTQTVTQQNLASLWDLRQVVVARAIENTAAEGATESNARLLNSKSALLVYSSLSPPTWEFSILPQ